MDTVVMNKNTYIVLIVLLTSLSALKIPAGTTVTNIVSLSTNTGSYHTYTGSGYSSEFSSPPGPNGDYAIQLAETMLSQAPSESTRIGFLTDAPTAVNFLSLPYAFGTSITKASQHFTIDLTAYTHEGHYVEAWLDWPCHFGPGTGGNQLDQVRSGPVIKKNSPLSLGGVTTADYFFEPYFFHPFATTHVGWGGWACDTPTVFIVQQIADVQPRLTDNPGCQRFSNVGDPMNVINGDMSLTENDLVVQAPGIPLEFFRWYGSVSTASGLMGSKWKCSADASAWTTNTIFNGLTNKWMVVRMGENDEWRPLIVTNGAVAIAHGSRWTGALETNGTCKVVLSAQLTCRFNTNGMLDRIEEPFGNFVMFTRTNITGTSFLTGMEHSNGQYLHFEYLSNLLTRVLTPSTNLFVRYAYTAAGDLTNTIVTVSNNEYATSYAYIDATHVLTQRVNAAGTVQTWAYEGVKATNSFTGDNRLHETMITYSTNGTPQTTVLYARNGTNISYSYEYDPLIQKIKGIYGPNISNSANWVGTRFGHDEIGNITLIEESDYRPGVLAWSKQSMKYDSHSRMTNAGYGYMVEATNQYGFGWNTNWDTLAWLLDPEGHRAEWDYTNGIVSVSRIFPSTNQIASTFYTYTSNGLLASVTNANGHWISAQYDALGFPTCGISQSGLTNWLIRDAMGNLKEIQFPSNNYDTNEPSQMIPIAINFDQDELGQIRRVGYPDSSFEIFAFDAIGNLTNHVDVAGRTNIYSWLPTRKLASTTVFLTEGGSNQAVTVGLNFDQQMNVLNINDELGRAIESYQLDLQNRPICVTNVEAQVMKIIWGLTDMAKQIIRFDGTSTTFAYDFGGRLSQIIYPDDTLSFTYYKNELQRTSSNRWGVISNAFDGANQLTLSRSSGLIPLPVSANYGYFPDGQLSNIVHLAGAATYELDEGDRIIAISVASSNLAQDAFNYSYDPISAQLSQVSYSNGLTCTYEYDILNRLTGLSWRNISNHVLKSRSYSYTPAGMISRINIEDGSHVEYSYDSLDRLTREKHIDVYGQISSDEKYEFDLAGNRTRKTVFDSFGNAVVSVGYTLGTGNRLASWTVPETNLMACFPVTGYASETIGSNDRFGALWVSNAAPGGMSVKPVLSGTNFWVDQMIVGMGTQKIVAAIRDIPGNTTYVTNSIIPTVVTNGVYQYNLAGCLTNIQYKGKDYSQSLGMAWNGQYQLTAITTNSSIAERYGYDAAGRRLWGWDVTAGTNWFVYDRDHVIADLNATGIVLRSYVWGPGIDNLLSITVYGETTNTYYALKDHLGSILALADGAGNIVESYKYDAWGRTKVIGANGNELSESAVGNRFCWQGREYSWETGLYFFRARWYEPVAGRWLSNDPLGVAGGLNQYIFTGNNPVNFRDPFGLCKENSLGQAYKEFMENMWDRLGAPIHNFKKNKTFLIENIRERIGFPVTRPNNPTIISQSCMRDADYLADVIGALGKGKGAPKGWKTVKGAPFNSHGQPVYKKGNNYLTPDADGHKGGAWKQFDLRGRRLGTYDGNGNKIGK